MFKHPSLSAFFSFACTDLDCQFTDASTDSDGSVTAWSWDFGDGTTSTAQNPAKSYATGGTYTVTLTVTDDGGASDSAVQDVTVSEPAGSDFTLSASGTKVRGRHVVDLAWNGSSAASFDVKRDGATVATVSGSSYTDNTGNRGGASYQYQVCEAGTSTCSNTVTVTF